MWDTVIGNLSQFGAGGPHKGENSTPTGSGCILCHAMGTGKIFQVCGFVEAFLRRAPSERVLIVVTVATIPIWVGEMDKWIPERDRKQAPDPNKQPRSFKLHVMDHASKEYFTRNMVRQFTLYGIIHVNLFFYFLQIIDSWKNGVLLVGYEIFRNLCNKYERSGDVRGNSVVASLINKMLKLLLFFFIFY